MTCNWDVIAIETENNSNDWNSHAMFVSHNFNTQMRSGHWTVYNSTKTCLFVKRFPVWNPHRVLVQSKLLCGDSSTSPYRRDALLKVPNVSIVEVDLCSRAFQKTPKSSNRLRHLDSRSLPWKNDAWFFSDFLGHVFLVEKNGEFNLTPNYSKNWSFPKSQHDVHQSMRNFMLIPKMYNLMHYF